MSYKYTYECNKCGYTINSKESYLNAMCFQLVKDNPHGLCLGKFRRQVSNDTKQIRLFFHAIGNYMKLKRILNIE